ncbi:dTDP-4-dehydrorhamnose reductase [Glaciecola siphonariae]|uniref:dTDP-4-dehydrorhamnose reductase n=1 Tax=Glaciecola siphonariae TaxID=521012 RepID=A0ABV9LV57_9ALTE
MILVIGKSGQLACALAALNNAEQAITCFGREQVDVFDTHDIARVFAECKPDAVINASAYTAVDQAESDYDDALAMNAHAVENIAKECAKQNIHFVHVSTDYVFAGDKGSPYLPEDQIAPLNAYGRTKAAGEQIINVRYLHNSCIIRTSWVYSASGKNFVKTMLMLMASKPALTVIDEQIGSPTSAASLAKACLLAAQNKITGTHHCTDEGVASWYDFAVNIQQQALALGMLSKSVPIEPVSAAAFVTPAKRPFYSVMSKASLKSALPTLCLPHWQDALREVLQQIQKG